MEKIYKTMKSVGAMNIVFGILLIVGAAAMGAFLIVGGAKLLHRKKDLTFSVGGFFMRGRGKNIWRKLPASCVAGNLFHTGT